MLISNTLKRVFDFLAAYMGLILLSPVFPFLAWRIKRDSPGPVFYRGRRAARNCGVFDILKFRTMYESPESHNGPRITAQDDPRVTPFGRWLRDTKLNELPQLWNVLRGEMSLVGPRPEDPEIAAEWPADVRDEVFSVRPGITSPASVIYCDEEKRLNGAGFMQIYMEDILPSKLRLDQLYVRYHSFWNDLDVLFYTLLILLPKLGKTSPPEESLIVGPISHLFRRYISWFNVDLLVTFLTISLTGLLWRSFGPLDVGWRVAVLMAVGFAFLFSLTNAVLGVNRIHWRQAPAADAFALLPGVALATILAMMFNFLFPESALRLLYGLEIPTWLFSRPLLDPGLILVAATVALGGFVFVRYRSRLITGLATRWVNMRGKAPPAQERALIVGSGETGQYVSLMLTSGTHREVMKIVGFVDDDFYKLDSRIQGINVIGRCLDIPELVSKYDIGIIIYAIHNITYKARREILDLCYKTPARTVYFPDIPATLYDIVYRDNGMRGDKTQTSNQNFVLSSPNSDLPCHICLSKLSPPQVNAWLDQLEHTASQGDMTLVLNQLQNIRRMVNDETTK